MLSHKTEDEHTVGHLERVGVAEVEFVLAVAALMVEGVDIPAELVHVADHRLEEPVGQHRGLQVVAPGRSVCHVLWHPGDDALVGIPEYVDLRLDSHVHPEADGCCLGDLVLQDAPEVMAVRLGMEVQVGRHHRVAAVPGQDGDRVEVGDGGALILMRAELPHALQRSDCVQLRSGGRVGEVLNRHALRFRDPVHVGVGTEHIPDTACREIPLQFRDICHHHSLLSYPLTAW